MADVSDTLQPSAPLPAPVTGPGVGPVRPARAGVGVLAGALAMVGVGGSVSVSSLLGDA